MAQLLRMVEITKAFPGVLANDHIDLEVERGEIHTLLGENGAGKTTLMNILYGLYQPQEGEIYLRGKRVTIESPREAIALGVGMVHQHFMLVPTLTVTENIILGTRLPFWPLLPVKKAQQRVTELSVRFGFKVDPRALVWQLAVGAQQRVEIMKALYRRADIIILDEPTSMLTPQETEELFSILRSLAREGHTIIFISHKLEEVMEISDRITVLRAGRRIKTLEGRDTNPHELARMMVGREVIFRLEKKELAPGEAVLQVEGLKALNDRGLPALKGVSFSISRGEVLGLAGVAGNGQSELAEVLIGVRPAIAGRVRISEKEMTNRTPREILDNGVAFIPEDRQREGLILDFTAAENLILDSFPRPPLCRRGLLDFGAIGKWADRLMGAYDIRAPGRYVRARQLSGGNQQKLIVARQLSRDPSLLIAVQPTRGLDVGATEYVRGKLLEAVQRGAAVLLISSDLEEIMALSDRIAVIYEGEIMGIAPAKETTVEAVGLMMAGARRMEEVRH